MRMQELGNAYLPFSSMVAKNVKMVFDLGTMFELDVYTGNYSLLLLFAF